MKNKFFFHVMLNSFQHLRRILKQVQNDKWFKFVPLLLIILAAAFLRLYRISEYLTFLGDEGRDVLVVKRMIVDHKFTLLGPTASVGGFFLGPVYYYFMLPFLWLWKLDPTGPAVMVALFGTATVYLVYLLGKEFFDKRTGLIAAGLYAISPLVISYSHSSWNPNLVPFFSNLIVLIIVKAVKNPLWWKYLLAGLFLGINLQLHYLAGFLAVILCLYLFSEERKQVSNLLNHYFLFGLGTILGLAPFLMFEIRHGFPNTQTIFKFIFLEGKDTGFVGLNAFGVTGDIIFRLFWRLLTHYPSFREMNLLSYPIISLWVYGIIGLIILSLGLFLYQYKKDSFRLKFLVLWFVLGVGLFLFYKKPVYDYYFGFMFVIPFLLVANFIRKTKLLGIIIFILLIGNAIEGVYFRFPANRQLEQIKTISRFAFEKTDSKPFNFALLATGNSDHAYRYFFEIWGNKPVVLENLEKDQKRESVTGQLLVICENVGDCHPLGHSLWEIAGFGRAEVVGQWDISFVRVVKLIHYQEPTK